jgi:hypothetical protein
MILAACSPSLQSMARSSRLLIDPAEPVTADIKPQRWARHRDTTIYDFLWGMPTSRTSARPASSRISISLIIILALHIGSRDVNLTTISPVAQEN